MASLTKIVEQKRRNKLRRSGRKRKKRLSRRSTLSQEELFGAPKLSSAK
jgi:hypothetical protein